MTDGEILADLQKWAESDTKIPDKTFQRLVLSALVSLHTSAREQYEWVKSLKKDDDDEHRVFRTDITRLQERTGILAAISSGLAILGGYLGLKT